MNIALWIAQVLLLGMYAVAGSVKVFQVQAARQRMPWTEGRSDAFVRFVGTSELLGALGLTAVQALAIATVHGPRRDFQVLPANLVLLFLALFVFVGRLPLFTA